MSLTVLYDANVLYPAPLRDILMQLALTGMYKAKWSNRIHEEWIRNVLKNRPDLSRAHLEKTKNLMNFAVLDCLVENYEDIEQELQLPDIHDRHVLAAAIASNCNRILTFNLKDFPHDALKRYSIEAQHPDDFMINLLDLNRDIFCSAIKTTRMRLKNPPKNINEYLDILIKQGLIKTVSILKNFQC